LNNFPNPNVRAANAEPPHFQQNFPKLPRLTARAIWLWIAAAYMLVILTTLWATGVLPTPQPPLLG
jgi:hypothetical protein